MIVIMKTVSWVYTRLYDFVVQKSQQSSDFKGREFWQPIKHILSKYDDHVFSWQDSVKTGGSDQQIFSTFASSLEEYSKATPDQMIVHHHFFLQTQRIPQQQLPTLCKIVQIALNTAQLKKYLRADYFDPKLLELIAQHPLDNIERYVPVTCANTALLNGADEAEFEAILKQWA